MAMAMTMTRKRASSCPPFCKSVKFIAHPLNMKAQQLRQVAAADKAVMEESEYGPEGYMPIEINQRIGMHNEYRIIRKLGWGTCSTVWLAYEDKWSKKYYALKMMKSLNDYTESACREARLLLFVQSRNTMNNVGRNRLVLYNTYFIDSSLSNRRHLGLVSEVLGPSVFDLVRSNNYHGCDEQGVKLVIKQVLEAVRYLHEECAIIHADIKSSNVLMCMKDSYAPKMDAYVQQFNKYRVHLPKSYVTSLEWSSHITDCATCASRMRDDASLEVKPLEVQPFLDDYCLCKSPKKHQSFFLHPNISIKLGDFGSAFFEVTPHPLIIQSRNCRALEVSLQAPYSYPVDIWTIGCLAYELMVGEDLIKLDNPSKISTTKSDLECIWKILGGIPIDIALSGMQSLAFFDLDGKLENFQEPLTRVKISEKLISQRDITPQRALEWENFILSLLSADPSERPTASVALTNEWLTH